MRSRARRLPRLRGRVTGRSSGSCRTRPPAFWDHPHDIGAAFQTERREQGQPLVDDPWRAVKEFVVGANGRIRLTYAYQYCEDYPAAQLLATAALLS